MSPSSRRDPHEQVAHLRQVPVGARALREGHGAHPRVHPAPGARVRRGGQQVTGATHRAPPMTEISLVCISRSLSF